MAATLTNTSARSANRLNPRDAALFGSGVPLGFAGGDANLTRYVGNNAVNLVDPFGLWAEEPDSKPTIANVGPVVLTNIAGVPLKDKDDKLATTPILEIKGDQVTIINPKTGKPITIPIASLSAADQTFITQLAAVPPNIIINPKSKLTAEDKSIWVKLVVADLAKLATLEKGKEILSGIAKVLNPPPEKVRDIEITPAGNPTLITIIPSTHVVEGIPDSTCSIQMNPITGVLDPTFPPTVSYNLGSKFPGLGKELWHAWKHLLGTTVPGADWPTWDVWAGTNVADVLREQGK